MKQVPWAAGAVAILLTTALATPVNAQRATSGSVSAGRGGGAPAAAAHVGGGGGRAFSGSGGGGAQFRSGGGGGGGAQFHANGHFRSSGNAGVQFHNRGNAGTHFARGADFGRHGGRHDGHFAHRRYFRGPVVGIGGPFFYDYGYDYGAPVYSYDDDCYRIRRVRTEAGWRNVRVYVCGDYDDD